MLRISFPLPCLAARHKIQRYQTKESSVDMSKMNHIFVGWVHHERVNYSAQLTLEADGSLNGSYSRGFMKEKSKGRPMHLTKQ